MIAAFFLLLSVYVNGQSDTIQVACPDLACVGHVVEVSRKDSRVLRVQVFTEKPTRLGPGEVITPALADYQWS